MPLHAQPSPPLTASAEQQKDGLPPDIVVEGRRSTDPYRIPEELRMIPIQPDHRASSIDPMLACHGVGPNGCGIEPLPILTVGSDGKVRVGKKD
jgi:hypothetical protein